MGVMTTGSMWIGPLGGGLSTSRACSGCCCAKRSRVVSSSVSGAEARERRRGVGFLLLSLCRVAAIRCGCAEPSQSAIELCRSGGRRWCGGRRLLLRSSGARLAGCSSKASRMPPHKYQRARAARVRLDVALPPRRRQGCGCATTHPAPGLDVTGERAVEQFVEFAIIVMVKSVPIGHGGSPVAGPAFVSAACGRAGCGCAPCLRGCRVPRRSARRSFLRAWRARAAGGALRGGCR